MTFTGPGPRGRSRRSSSRCSRSGWRSTGCIRSTPRPCATATGRSCSWARSNHGKSMGQIEACRRGAKLVSTETTVIDDRAAVILGSKAPFLKKRDAGHRTRGQGRARGGRRQVLRRHADLGDPRRPDAGRRRRPPGDRRQLRAEPGRDDPVRAAVPDAPLAPELLPAQRAARAGPPDADGRYGALRKARAGFVERFAERPYYFVRAATPQVLLDEVSGSSDAMQRFAYERPGTLGEAIGLLVAHGARRGRSPVGRT